MAFAIGMIFGVTSLWQVSVEGNMSLRLSFLLLFNIGVSPLTMPRITEFIYQFQNNIIPSLALIRCLKEHKLVGWATSTAKHCIIQYLHVFS